MNAIGNTLDHEMPFTPRTVTSFSALEVSCIPCERLAGEQCSGGRVCPERLSAARSAANSGLIATSSYEPPPFEYGLARDGITGRDFPPSKKAARGRQSRKGELWAQVVKLRESGMLWKEISKELRVSDACLLDWRKQENYEVPGA